VKAWERALEKFLAQWKTRREVTGALVCGSYITGNPDSHSDIDVHILLRETIRWRERGNRIIDGYLIEYFVNPPKQIRAYFSGDYRSNRAMTATQFVTGRILFDKAGAVRRLKREAERCIARPLKKSNRVARELSNYALWDQLDNLRAVVKQKSPVAAYVYHNALKQLFDSYCNIIGYPISGANRAHAILTDARTRKKYLLDRFPDAAFSRSFVRALRETKLANMCLALEKLTDRVQRKSGGFKLDGWKIRTPLSCK